ncbi:MAG: extracellular solute-binding protein [Eubacteriales bacterium]|nr:extracellular solute-binding protein [Eubacteriales bacterium]
MRKVLSLILALAMAMTMLTAFATTAVAEVTKPESISIFIDGTVFTTNNARDAFQARWEELTGIKLEITQPDHDAYYDVLQQQIASGDWPDVMILSSTYYSAYAAEGVLWDMTDAWEASDLKASGRFTGDSVVEGLKIDGRLYGFSPTRGNGCVTYVKQAWLDAVGMQAPTNWDEYYAMLQAFTTQNPDGDDKKETFGVAAAGFVGPEAPYVNYLPEFYQDGTPTFDKDENGVWFDGFTQDSMKAALERLNKAYVDGVIDPTTLTNGTKDCRNKYYDDTFGAFTYWAGTWATNLKSNLEANNLSGELVALPPIAEVGAYLDRVPPVWAISSACENPEGVYKYFIDTMLDGGDMQMLWTYGVEDVHWSMKAETVLAGTDKEKTYEDGQFHMKESLEQAGTVYTKHHIDPMLALASFAEGYYDPREDSVKAEAKAASELFNTHSKLAIIVPTTEEMSMYNGDLVTLKNELIAKVTMGDLSYEQAMAKFESDGGAEWSKAIVDSLNALNK